jgi:hypothetical protein
MSRFDVVIDDLTGEEMDTVEDILGTSIVGGGASPTKLTKALAFVILKRDDAELTYAALNKRKYGDILAAARLRDEDDTDEGKAEGA